MELKNYRSTECKVLMQSVTISGWEFPRLASTSFPGSKGSKMRDPGNEVGLAYYTSLPANSNLNYLEHFIR